MIENCPGRRRRKGARPSEIIEAARASFVEHGFAATRVEEIAGRAGVSKGTVYLYFPTKEALFEAVARANVLPVLEGIAAALLSDSETPAPQQLRMLLTTMYREVVGTDRRKLLHMVIAEGPRFPGLTAFYHREFFCRGRSMLRALLERGERRGEFKLGAFGQHPEILIAPAIVAAVKSSLFEAHETYDLDSYCEAHIALLLRALGAEETKPV